MPRWLRFVLLLGLLFFLVQSPIEAADVVTLVVDFFIRLFAAFAAFFTRIAARY
jgi:hypothetical protein